jgi:hypothetical protein
MVTVNQLLQHLPPFRNERILIKQDQRVHDIIEQILKAHEKYRHYYDKIAIYFDDEDTEKICNNLYKFLEKNIEYKEESDEEQTTAVPSAILSLKHGDCKHYSSFTAGVLDALNRQGRKINWCYRFCSYKLLEKTPHHVFVVVKNKDGSESWIDPVPGANKLTPVWQLDKQPKKISMPLHDVIGNTNSVAGAAIGYTFLEQTTHATYRVNPLFIAGRAAFLQMVQLNVKAWAKNMDYLITTQGTRFTDPLGKKWYLLGGRWDNLRSAIEEGKDKKMIGGTNDETIGALDIVALLAAAAPIIIAITSVIKSAMGNDSWEQGQLVYPTTGTGTPTTGTGTDLLKNPLVLAGAAGLLYYMYSRKKKVSGTDNTMMWVLLLGGGLLLYKKSQQQLPAPDEPIVIDPEPVSSGTSLIDNAMPEPSDTTQNTFVDTNSGGGGGGGSSDADSKIPVEYMM